MGLASWTDRPSWSRSADRKSRCAQWRPWFHTSRPITPCSMPKTLSRFHVKFCETEKFQSGSALPIGSCRGGQEADGVMMHTVSRTEIGMPQLSGRPHGALAEASDVVHRFCVMPSPGLYLPVHTMKPSLLRWNWLEDEPHSVRKSGPPEAVWLGSSEQ